jgi:hypothetical protein
MARRIFKAAAVAASLALAAPAAVAHAGRYHVYSCRTPAGDAAPVDGWSGSVAGTFAYAANSCAHPNGALLAALGDEPTRSANNDVATWAFGALASETISSATVWRAGDADGGGAVGGTYEFWFAGPENVNNPANAFGLCVSGMQCPSGLGDFANPFADANRVVVPSANLGRHFFFDASCVGEPGFSCPAGKGDANGYAAALYLFAADLTLEENEDPHASNVSGELATAPTVQGDSDLAFDATDSGTGVYEALFSVDGQVVQRTVLDSNGGRCRDVGQTTDGLAAFEYVQPCEQSLSADVPFDTTKVANGAHHLIVSVIDAAGNAAPVLDRTIAIANPAAPGAPNGVNASTQATLAVRWRLTRKPSLTTGFGHAQVLAGRLTGPGGVPIVGAAIDVRATPSFAGARSVQLPALRTGPDGRFELRVVGGGSSKSLRFAYRAHIGDAQPVATKTLTLKVRADIALRVSPHTTSVGRRIAFRGRLRGGPIPRGGKQLVLEARSPGSSWIEFKVVRTDAHGRYRAAYRFKFPGPADYRFRARSEPESDFPFAGGSSNVVAVHER